MRRIFEMTARVHEVSMDRFESIVDTNEIVLLDFWASWCAPCRVFAPLFDELAESHPDLYFGKVNTESAVDLAQAFQVRTIPTLMAFKKGELVFEQSGVLSAAALNDLIEKLRVLDV